MADLYQLKGRQGRHIGGHLLLLWAKFEYFHINQSLEHIFEDVAEDVLASYDTSSRWDHLSSPPLQGVLSLAA